jgi:TolB-like protein
MEKIMVHPGQFTKPRILFVTSGLLLVMALFPACGTTPSEVETQVSSGAETRAESSRSIETDCATEETFCSETTSPLLDLDGAIGSLADQISASAACQERQRVALLDFTAIREDSELFGRFLAEELIARFFLSDRFDVVERRLLDRVIEEQKLSHSDLVDEQSIRALGRILGVDAILTGTCTDVGTEIRANGRLIAIESGRILAVAKVRIEKDERVATLLTGEQEAERLPAGGAPDEEPAKVTASASRGVDRRHRPGKPFRKAPGNPAGKHPGATPPRGGVEAARPVADGVSRVRELYLRQRIPESARAAKDLLSDRNFKKNVSACDLGWISFVLTEAIWKLQGKGPAVKRDRYDEPMELARKAVEIDPGDAMAQCALGQVLHRTGRHKEAVERFEAALKLDPQSRGLPPQLRKSLQVSGRFVNGRRPRLGD